MEYHRRRPLSPDSSVVPQRTESQEDLTANISSNPNSKSSITSDNPGSLNTSDIYNSSFSISHQDQEQGQGQGQVQKQEQEQEQPTNQNQGSRPVMFLHVPGGTAEEDIARGARVALELIKALVGSREVCGVGGNRGKK